MTGRCNDLDGFKIRSNERQANFAKLSFAIGT